LGDTPVPLLYKELDKRFEGSKFILTTREKKRWLESMKWMFGHGKVIWKWDETIHSYHRRFYGTGSYNEKILSKLWDNYHDEVFDYFSDRPNDFMIIKLEDGFNVRKISEFIGVPYRNIKDTRKNSRQYAKPHQIVKYYTGEVKARLRRFLTKHFG
jgi:hypothetical protein